jgi:tRNA pseudouridine38-40 synthase
MVNANGLSLHSFDTFLTSVDNSFTDNFKYLNPDGVIPDECIVVTKYSKEQQSRTDEDQIGEDD